MDKRQYVEDITNYLKEQTRRREIAADALILDSGIVDSFGVIELVSFIEERYKVQLSGAEMTGETFASIDSIADLLVARENLAGSKASA